MKDYIVNYTLNGKDILTQTISEKSLTAARSLFKIRNPFVKIISVKAL